MLTFLWDRAVTWVHIVQVFIYPVPNWPLEFNPQTNTSNLEVKAKEWLEPAAIIIIFLPNNDLIKVGSYLFYVIPWPNPNWPWEQKPQAYKWPLLVKNRECFPPKAICYILVF